MRRKFTQTEIDFLRSNYGKMPTREIAQILDRSPASTVSKAHKLGLCPNNSRRYFTPIERSTVIELIEQGCVIDEIAKALQRSKKSIKGFMYRQGLKAKYWSCQSDVNTLKRRPWSKEEEMLLMMLSGTRTAKKASKKFRDRSEQMIRDKIYRLGSSWRQGTISRIDIAKTIGISRDKASEYLKRLHLTKCDNYITDYSVIQKVAQAILDNNRATAHCRPSLKHLEACARGEVWPE